MFSISKARNDANIGSGSKIKAPDGFNNMTILPALRDYIQKRSRKRHCDIWSVNQKAIKSSNAEAAWRKKVTYPVTLRSTYPILSAHVPLPGVRHTPTLL